MKKLLIIVYFFSVLLFANESVTQSKKVVLQLSWLNQFQFAGYYMAIEKGYYKQVGLDVEIKEFSSNINLVDEILDGNAQFGIGRSSLLVEKSEGKDIVALAAIYQQSPLMLLTLKNKGISSLKDLKNKNIMITSDAKTSASIMAMFSSQGISKDDLNIQKHSFNLDDLISGKTDAMASYVSNEPIRLEDKDIEYNIFHPKDYGFEFYDDILFTSTSFMRNNPQLTEDFYKASVRGWKYAFDNIIQTSEVIYKKYNTQNRELIDLIKEGQVLKTLIHHNGSEAIGCLDKGKLTEILGVYKVSGLVKNDFDLNSFMYDKNTHKILYLRYEKNELYIFIFLILFLIMLIIAIVFFITIKKKWLHTTNELEKIIAEQRLEITKQNQYIISQSKISAVSELLQNIAHQWRQPLTIMTSSMSSIKLMLELDGKVDRKVLDDSIDLVLNESKYLSKTIDDFSTFFIKEETSLKDYNIKELFDLIEEIYKYKLEKNNIIYVKNIEENIQINTNKALFVQSIAVMYKNSLEAFESNNVNEDDRYLYLEVKSDEDNIKIILKDSAGGIKKDYIDKIFEPYFTTKHKSVGTGIGLYMTYQTITKHMGGKITVQNSKFKFRSKKLDGVTFEIELSKVK